MAQRNRKSELRTPKSAYAAAGVNIALGDALKSGLHAKIRRTFRPEVLGRIGGFGGLFALDTRKYHQPVLVSSVDGVGTKIKIARMVGRHDTVGQDLVNHCCNDIAVLGAEPLFFLDYIGVGKLEPKVFNELIEGLSKACASVGCALIGGETAQLPGIYQTGDYDLVGCIVGVVEKARILDGSKIRPGDVILGLPSTGLHTNGYSLARKILLGRMRVGVDDFSRELGCTFGRELLKVHCNYAPTLLTLRRSHASAIHGLAHITGGGFLDNIPRVLPKGCTAVIRRGTWPVLPIFDLLQSEGSVDDAEMFRVFNMGIGMVLIVAANQADAVQRFLARQRQKSYVIGEIVRGKRKVKIV